MSFSSVRHVRVCVVFKRQAARIDNILQNSLIIEHKNHKKDENSFPFKPNISSIALISMQYRNASTYVTYGVKGRVFFLTVYTNRSVYRQEIVTCFEQNSEAWVEEIC